MNLSLEEHLALLQEKGVRFWVESGKLKYRSADTALTPDALEWIRENIRAIGCHCLEKELALARWKYESCIGFEYRPFRRDLSPACIAAGKKAILELQQQIHALESQIQRLKQFDSSSSQKRLSENSNPDHPS